MTPKLRVLLVEDFPDDAELLLRELERTGEYKVQSSVAIDKPTFERLLCDQHWDVIICDYHLIGITAADLILVLEEYGSTIPFIVVSGSMTQEQEQTTNRPYLLKSNLGRLLPVIRHELDQVRAYEQIILSWGRAIELKDRDTSGHTQRVMQLAVDLAQQLRLCWPDICNVKYGAYLHDIGKILVSDEILQKPGRLNAEELAEMRLHPVHAYQILKPMKFLRKAMEVAYCHHELWDGGGYPQGLRGTDIPILARIFTVADNYDAMTSDRSYRKALSTEFTLTFIYQNSGKMFDPDIVAAFMTMMKARLK